MKYRHTTQVDYITHACMHTYTCMYAHACTQTQPSKKNMSWHEKLMNMYHCVCVCVPVCACLCVRACVYLCVMFKAEYLVLVVGLNFLFTSFGIKQTKICKRKIVYLLHRNEYYCHYANVSYHRYFQYIIILKLTSYSPFVYYIICIIYILDILSP